MNFLFLLLVSAVLSILVQQALADASEINPTLNRVIGDKDVENLFMDLAAERIHADSAEEFAEIRAIVRALYKAQHLTPEECRTKRLLVTQFAATSFEGVGSNLFVLIHSLAEAIHSNRTLVWGLDLPRTFEISRPVWHTSKPSILIANETYNCDGWTLGGGPYSCFFLPISTCSLADVSPLELERMAIEGFDDTARVRISESRRGIAAFHAPKDIPEFKEIFDKIKEKANHKWAAALGAYSFRLKKNVFDRYEHRRQFLWKQGLLTKFIDGNNGDNLSEISSSKLTDTALPVWTVHVRQGDVKVVKEYGNRKSYNFRSYFARAKAILKDLPVHERPEGLLVLSDSVDTDAALVEEQPWMNVWNVKLFTPNNSTRFRTEHGSHTVAANGGCVLRSCALHWQDILYYQQFNYSVPHLTLQVIAEAIEDIYLLSFGDRIISQMTSHFSTMGVLLSWARRGKFNPAHDVFLDLADVESGRYSCGYLHGGLNGTSAIPKGRYSERWMMATRRFIEGLEHHLISEPSETEFSHNSNKKNFDSNSDEYRMGISDYIPQLPEDTFYSEAKRWLGTSDSDSIWVNECTGYLVNSKSMLAHPNSKKSKVDEIGKEIVSAINLGADHHVTHPGQALLCWRRALVALEARKKKEERDFIELVKENIRTTSLQMLNPYSMGTEKVEQFMNLLRVSSDSHDALLDDFDDEL